MNGRLASGDYEDNIRIADYLKIAEDLKIIRNSDERTSGVRELRLSIPKKF